MERSDKHEQPRLSVDHRPCMYVHARAHSESRNDKVQDDPAVLLRTRRHDRVAFQKAFFMRGGARSRVWPESSTRHLLRPGLCHLRFVRRVLSYLVKTHNITLTYRRGATFNFLGAWFPGDGDTKGVLHGISDASFGAPHSVSGMLVMLAGAAVAWRVVLQRTPSLSPAESEFYALTSTVCEVVTTRHLLEDLGFVFEAATQVFTDSRAARLLADQGGSSARTRHIHRREHFVAFHTREGTAWISAIRGDRNPANALTKFTYGVMFLRERAYFFGIRRRD